MKKFYLQLLFLASFLVLGSTTNVQAQCLDWLAPSPTTGWIDFNLSFGGAPCDDGMGCPFNEIQDFEVFASEAYNVAGVQMGGSYTFSMCNGPGAGTWVPEFTIIAPSGTVDAFGAGDGDGCSITWTASEAGEYLIVINEAGQCGGGPNTGTSNGYPALTCNSGAPCEPADPCNAGTFTTTGEELVCGSDMTVDLMTTDAEVSFPAAGGFGWLFDNNTGGTGGPAGPFILTGAPTMESYNSDLNGILAANMLPLMEGAWVIKPAVYENSADPFNTICAISMDSIIVTFANSVPSVDAVDNGDGSATATATGGTAPYTYEWSDGQTTATATGITTSGTFEVTVTDGFGCTAVASIDVIGTSVSDIENITALQVGPNPTAGELFVNFQLKEAQTVRIELMNTNGQILTVNDLGTTLSFADRMDLSSYANGVYFIRLTVGEQSTTERVLLMQ